MVKQIYQNKNEYIHSKKKIVVMVRIKYSLEYKWRVVNLFLNASPKVSLGKMERITNIKRQLISGKE